MLPAAPPTTEQPISYEQQQLATDLKSLMEKKCIPQVTITSMTGLSTSTISELLNNKRAFSNAVLGKVRVLLMDMHTSKQLFTGLRQYQQLFNMAEATRKQKLFTLAVGNTGVGKTTTVRHLYSNNPDTFYVNIDFPISWRALIRKTLHQLGVNHVPYRSEEMIELLRNRLTQLSDKNALLIIDEAEILTTNTLFKLKSLFTLAEGQIGMLVVAHSSLKSRLAKAARVDAVTGQVLTGREETAYATMYRRLTHFTTPAVSEEDIRQLCATTLQISDKKVIARAQLLWGNYGVMAKQLSIIQQQGISPADMREEDLLGIANIT